MNADDDSRPSPTAGAERLSAEERERIFEEELARRGGAEPAATREQGPKRLPFLLVATVLLGIAAAGAAGAVLFFYRDATQTPDHVILRTLRPGR